MLHQSRSVLAWADDGLHFGSVHTKLMLDWCVVVELLHWVLMFTAKTHTCHYCHDMRDLLHFFWCEKVWTGSCQWQWCLQSKLPAQSAVVAVGGTCNLCYGFSACWLINQGIVEFLFYYVIMFYWWHQWAMSNYCYIVVGPDTTSSPTAQNYNAAPTAQGSSCYVTSHAQASIFTGRTWKSW